MVSQVDSVLPADGWRPVRRHEDRSSHKKAQEAPIYPGDFCAFLWFVFRSQREFL
jgi:hypothetical protein